jgi:hypothetical protein
MVIGVSQASGVTMEGEMANIWVTYLLLVLLTMMALIPAVVYLAKRNADLFEPIYWASAYFFLLFVVRTVYSLSLGSVFLGEAPFDPHTQYSMNLGLIYALLSFVVFLAGYYSRVGRSVACSLPGISLQWDAGRIKVFCPIILVIGVLSFFVMVQTHGGWSLYTLQKQETLTASGQGYLLIGVSFITYVYVILLTQTLSTRRVGYLTFLVLLPVVLFIGFVSGSKGIFIVPVLATFIAVHYLRRRIHLRSVLLFVVFVFMLFPVFNLYRSTSDISKLPAYYADSIGVGWGEGFVRHVMSRFYGIDALTLVIRDTPEVMDYQLGKTILPLTVVWVPRQLWEDKPIVSFGKVFAETYMGDVFSGTGTSASPTILGEAYLNFHIGGMLWIALLSGIIIRAFYEYFIRRRFGAPAIFIYSLFFLSLFLFWEASIAGFIARQAIGFLVLFILVMIMGKRRVNVRSLDSAGRTGIDTAYKP